MTNDDDPPKKVRTLEYAVAQLMTQVPHDKIRQVEEAIAEALEDPERWVRYLVLTMINVNANLEGIMVGLEKAGILSTVTYDPDKHNNDPDNPDDPNVH